MKKTPLTVAVLTALTLAGCLGSGDGDNVTVDKPQTTPPAQKIPSHNDGNNNVTPSQTGNNKPAQTSDNATPVQTGDDTGKKTPTITKTKTDTPPIDTDPVVDVTVTNLDKDGKPVTTTIKSDQIFPHLTPAEKQQQGKVDKDPALKGDKAPTKRVITSDKRDYGQAGVEFVVDSKDPKKMTTTKSLRDTQAYSFFAQKLTMSDNQTVSGNDFYAGYTDKANLTDKDKIPTATALYKGYGYLALQDATAAASSSTAPTTATTPTTAAAPTEKNYIATFEGKAKFADKTFTGTFSDFHPSGLESGATSTGDSGRLNELFPEKLPAADGQITAKTFSATIDGNKLLTKDNGTAVSGNFYGADAAEVAGTIKGNDYRGAFGGKKQPPLKVNANDFASENVLQLTGAAAATITKGKTFDEQENATGDAQLFLQKYPQGAIVITKVADDKKDNKDEKKGSTPPERIIVSDEKDYGKLVLDLVPKQGGTGETDTSRYLSKKLSYSRFGQKINAKNEMTFYSYGDVTPYDAATADKIFSGMATYQGNGYLKLKADNDNTYLTDFVGKADFDDRDFTGTFSKYRALKNSTNPGNRDGVDNYFNNLTADNTKPAQTFNAKIVGNTLVNSDTGTTLNARFYGKSADEVGGLIKTDTYQGSFGGAKATK